MPTLTTLLSALGALTLLRLLYHLLRFIHLYTRPSSLPRYHHAPPTEPLTKPWALITGSTDGIGLAFAHALAHQNFNILLHGRNPAKLSSLAHSLSTSHPTSHFQTLALDASLPLTEPQSRALTARVTSLHLTILINNVGGVDPVMTAPAMRPIAAHPAPAIPALIALNAGFPTQITHACWPVLVRNSPALVMNVGSLASVGMPYLSVYGGTKAYLDSFTRALVCEVQAAGAGVEVLGVTVGRVTGVSHRKDGSSLVMPGTETMVRAALGRVGCGRAVVAGYWAHGVQVAALGVLPEWLQRRMLLGAIRGEVERKKEEEKVRKSA